MELRLLKYFWTVAELGSVTAAAEELYITQPTLSRQIKELEKELGTPLFTRDKNRLELTEAGLFVRSRAEEILSLTQQTEQEFSDRRRNMFSGHIHIGAVEAESSQFLGAVLESFVRDYPQVTFCITTGSGDIIKDQLDKGLVDVGVLLEPITVNKYSSIRLPIKEEWGLFVPHDSFLASQTSLSPVDFDGLPLLISARPEVQELLRNWMGSDIHPEIIGNFNLTFNALPLVERHVGNAVAIRGTARNLDTRKPVFLPLTPALTTYGAVVWKKNRVMTPLVSEFVRRLKHASEA